MLTSLDQAQLIDVTEALFGDDLTSDASVAMVAFRHQFGVSSASSIEIDGLRGMRYEPSGLIVRSARGRIQQAWAPKGTDPSLIDRWRQSMEAELKPSGTQEITLTVLCGAPIGHRWDIPEIGLTIFPVPRGSPVPPCSAADHAAMARFSINRRASHSVNAVLASRRLEVLVHLLAATTHLRPRHMTRQRNSWGWARGIDDRSRWVQLTYFSPELVDPDAVERTFTTAPLGPWADDRDYYLHFGAGSEGRALLPESLGQTLAAADGLPAEDAVVLHQALRWMHAADEAASISSSMAFVALISAVEALSGCWNPELGKKQAVAHFFADMLSCYSGVAEVAKDWYRLRCGLVHEARVFPDDWADVVEDDDGEERTALWRASLVMRLATVNWIRARSGIAMVSAR